MCSSVAHVIRFAFEAASDNVNSCRVLDCSQIASSWEVVPCVFIYIGVK